MGSGSTVVLLLALCHAAAASRQLLVRVTPDNPPVTVPYNLPPSDSEYSTLGWIPDLTMSELAPADLGVDPEQVLRRVPSCTPQPPNCAAQPQNCVVFDIGAAQCLAEKIQPAWLMCAGTCYTLGARRPAVQLDNRRQV